MAEKVKIVIDDKEYEVEKGKSVLQAALENGIDIPYFCYHQRLSIAGACRMCVVYWENINRLVISCNTPVQEGMIIRTHHTSEQVKENQKYLLQALMTRHPLDCPICDKAGECDLQNFGAIYGPQRQVVPISALEKEREEHDWDSDFLEYYSNRCVVCYRCTRACDEIVGAHALYVENRGFDSNIVPTVRPMDTSTCEMCGICVHVCPVGAIISKPFKFWSRSWLLQRETTRCNLCPVGCEVQLEYGVGDWRSKKKVYRTKPTEDLNICAKAFFGYDALNVDRLLSPSAHGREESVGNLVNLLSSVLGVHERETAFVLSGYLPNEIIDSVVKIAKATSSYVTAPQTADFSKLAEALGEYQPPTIEEVKDADFYVFVGDDITSTATVLTYYTKGKVYRVGKGFRDEKFEPEEITLEDVNKLEGKGVVAVNTTSFGGDEEIGKKLKEIQDKGHRILLLPKEGNVYGLYQRIKDIYSDVDEVVKKALEGEINTLVVFGEDLTEYYHSETMEQLADRLEHLVVASPYDFGLSVRATVKVPMALMGETEGTFTTLFGEVKGKKFLPWAFDDISFWKYLEENLSGREGEIKIVKGNSTPPLRPEVHIYRNGWITKRSENLSKLYEKNREVSEYRV